MTTSMLACETWFNCIQHNHLKKVSKFISECLSGELSQCFSMKKIKTFDSRKSVKEENFLWEQIR